MSSNKSIIYLFFFWSYQIIYCWLNYKIIFKLIYIYIFTFSCCSSYPKYVIPSFSFLRLFSYPYGFIFSIRPFGSKHDEINSIFKIGEVFETSFIFEILSKLCLSAFSNASVKFSFPNSIFSNLNLFISSIFPDSVGIRVFFFFSVVISFIDDLS